MPTPPALRLVSPGRRRNRILIVDDERIVAWDLASTLTELGYSVLGPVSTGEEAIEQIRELQPDIVLMDIYLAGDIDGIDAVLGVRGQRNRIPVIYLTAHSDDETRCRAGQTNPVDYLLKPVSSQELRRAVAAALQSGVSGVHSAAIDMQAAAESLRHDEERFQALASTCAQIVWTTTGAGDMVEDSPTWRAFTGQVFQWRGRGWLDAVHPEDREGLLQRWHHVVETVGPLNGEYRIKHRSGEWRWTEVRTVPLLKRDGSVREWIAMSTDITDRRLSAEYFRLAIEAAPTGMLMVDSAGKIVLVNTQIEVLFGYRREELIGQPVEILVPHRFRAQHPGDRVGFFQRPHARPMGAGRDLYGISKDGNEIPVEIGLNPLVTSDGNFVLSSVVDISGRRREERQRQRLMSQLQTLNLQLEERVRHRTLELSTALKERDVLLQEVHHRVKNNLQVISSLLNMQMRALEAGTSRDALEECQTRVQAIALIHEQLYRSKDYSQVSFSEYASALVWGVLRTAGASPARITLDMAVEPIGMAVDTAIPCGLILNELVTNSVKHAFPYERNGKVRVELRRLAAGRMLLAVTDDGIGLPRDFDIQRAASMGLQLVRTLTEQLNGDLRATSEGGASFELTFPFAAVL